MSSLKTWQNSGKSTTSQDPIVQSESTATELSHPLVGERKKNPNFKHLLSLLVTSSLPITRTDYSQFKNVGGWKEQREINRKKRR